DWSSDVCSSDLGCPDCGCPQRRGTPVTRQRGTPDTSARDAEHPAPPHQEQGEELLRRSGVPGGCSCSYGTPVRDSFAASQSFRIIEMISAACAAFTIALRNIPKSGDRLLHVFGPFQAERFHAHDGGAEKSEEPQSSERGSQHGVGTTARKICTSMMCISPYAVGNAVSIHLAA